MSELIYPKAEEVDICLILEGTYPYLSGGVANWVHELIKIFPQYTFAAIFLGTSAEDYGKPFYKLPPNVKHLGTHYLFRTDEELVDEFKSIDKKTLNNIKNMHAKCADFLTSANLDLQEIYTMMEEGSEPSREAFFRAKESWDLIVERYYKQHAHESFFEYFWTVRNLHRPFWEIKKMVNQIPKCKILHTASTGYAGFLGALLQNKQNVPYVITEHGIYTKERWIEIMRHFFFKLSFNKSSHFIEETPMQKVWTNFFGILAKMAYQKSETIISLTEEYRQRQISDGAEAQKTQIISYGIDFNQYKFLNKQFNAKKPIFACIGRVVPIKDIKTFIRAAAIVLNKIPEAEAWVVGSMTEDPTYTQACVNLITTLGFEHKIKLLGTQNMMEIYQKIDLLILTSISEGSPFVMLESLAVGLPIVATDVGGCGELIHGKNSEDKALGTSGRLVQIANPVATANAAIELLTNKELWETSQKIGLERVRKYYSMQQVNYNYGQIYDKAIAHGGNRI